MDDNDKESKTTLSQQLTMSLLNDLLQMQGIENNIMNQQSASTPPSPSHPTSPTPTPYNPQLLLEQQIKLTQLQQLQQLQNQIFQQQIALISGQSPATSSIGDSTRAQNSNGGDQHTFTGLPTPGPSGEIRPQQPSIDYMSPISLGNYIEPLPHALIPSSSPSNSPSLSSTTFQRPHPTHGYLNLQQHQQAQAHGTTQSGFQPHRYTLPTSPTINSQDHIQSPSSPIATSPIMFGSNTRQQHRDTTQSQHNNNNNNFNLTQYQQKLHSQHVHTPGATNNFSIPGSSVAGPHSAPERIAFNIYTTGSNGTVHPLSTSATGKNNINNAGSTSWKPHNNNASVSSSSSSSSASPPLPILDQDISPLTSPWLGARSTSGSGACAGTGTGAGGNGTVNTGGNMNGSLPTGTTSSSTSTTTTKHKRAASASDDEEGPSPRKKQSPAIRPTLRMTGLRGIDTKERDRGGTEREKKMDKSGTPSPPPTTGSGGGDGSPQPGDRDWEEKKDAEESLGEVDFNSGSTSASASTATTATATSTITSTTSRRPPLKGSKSTTSAPLLKSAGGGFMSFAGPGSNSNSGSNTPNPNSNSGPGSGSGTGPISVTRTRSRTLATPRGGGKDDSPSPVDLSMPPPPVPGSSSTTSRPRSSSSSSDLPTMSSMNMEVDMAFGMGGMGMGIGMDMDMNGMGMDMSGMGMGIGMSHMGMNNMSMNGMGMGIGMGMGMDLINMGMGMGGFSGFGGGGHGSVNGGGAFGGMMDYSGDAGDTDGSNTTESGRTTHNSQQHQSPHPSPLVPVTPASIMNLGRMGINTSAGVSNGAGRLSGGTATLSPSNGSHQHPHAHFVNTASSPTAGGSAATPMTATTRQSRRKEPSATGVSTRSSARGSRKSVSSTTSPNLKPLLPAGSMMTKMDSPMILSTAPNTPRALLPTSAMAAVSNGNTSQQQPIHLRKTSHKAAEQKRRDSLKTTFDDLRKLLPPILLPTDSSSPSLDPSTPHLLSSHPSSSSSANFTNHHHSSSASPSSPIFLATTPLLPGSLPPRGPPKAGGEGPNKGVSKLQLLICGNEFIRVLKARVERRDEEIERLRREVGRLRGLVNTSGGDDGDMESTGMRMISMPTGMSTMSRIDEDGEGENGNLNEEQERERGGGEGEEELDLERDLDAIERLPPMGGGGGGVGTVHLKRGGDDVIDEGDDEGDE